MLKFSWNAADHVKALAPCRFLDAPKPGLLPSRRRAAAAAVVSCYPASKVPSLGVVSDGSARVEAGSGSLADRLRLGSLTEDGLSYKERFIVRCCEVGINKTATVETIANLLQEVACNQVQNLGFSTYMAWSDVVEIETWFHGEGRIGTRRDWILKDHANGQVIGRATSKWVMMNQETRRLQKVNDDVRDEYLIFCPQESRLAFPEENNGSLKKIARLEDPAQYSKLGLVPRRTDLDMNQHVNNVAYIGWVLESMPQEIIDSYELQAITLDYRRECRHSDGVDSLSSHEPDENLEAISQLNGTNGSAASPATEDYPQFLHLLRLSGDGLEINRGRTQWRKKPMR
ncbi:hypothetical protein BT93_H0545 [Corymbia citriodora subsp. variegata]|nr:hypothetical protein BT93_H0545 [Corymbia citriodora subsp. variegata]